MQIVFLDIDGVLNYRGSRTLHRAMVEQLNRITALTGALIVVHSSWRYGYGLEKIKVILSDQGVNGHITDVTPKPEGAELKFSGDIVIGKEDWANFIEGMPSTDERAVSIQHWLSAHPDVKDYVILDDSNDLGHFVGTKRFIQTVMGVGLTRELADKAILLLKRVTW